MLARLLAALRARFRREWPDLDPDDYGHFDECP